VPRIYIVAEHGVFAASLAMIAAAVLRASWLSASFALAYVARTGNAIVAFIRLFSRAENLRLWLGAPDAPPQRRPWDELSGAAAATPTSCRTPCEVQKQDT
jgi:ribulose-5-phosphate 4-epimerase/fuculose-1-phosphate aldolase